MFFFSLSSNSFKHIVEHQKQLLTKITLIRQTSETYFSAWMIKEKSHLEVIVINSFELSLFLAQVCYIGRDEKFIIYCDTVKELENYTSLSSSLAYFFDRMRS